MSTDPSGPRQHGSTTGNEDVVDLGDESASILEKRRKLNSEFPPRTQSRMETTGERYSGRCSSEELRLYTKNFSQNRFLGDTMVGMLYRATMPSLNQTDEKEVIVKRVKSRRGYAGFVWGGDSSRLITDEVLFLQNHHHPNLVNVIGYCYRGPEWGIVYDLNPVDTLRNLIVKGDFNWIQRIKVARGLAVLLNFLHSQEDPYIVRNLDTAHIMIDQDFNPRLIDFSMLSGGILGDKASQDPHTFVVPGYSDINIWETGKWTTKTDIYIYGMILLNLIAKRVYREEDRPRFFIDDWARKEYDQQERCSLVHTSLQQEPTYSDNHGKEITKMAMKCLDSEVINRPTMNVVVDFLQEGLRAYGI